MAMWRVILFFVYSGFHHETCITEPIKHKTGSNRSIKEKLFFIYFHWCVFGKSISIKRNFYQNGIFDISLQWRFHIFFPFLLWKFRFLFLKLIGVHWNTLANYHHIFHKNSQNLNWKCRNYICWKRVKQVWKKYHWPTICWVCH